MLDNNRVERMLSVAKRCLLKERCLLRHYANGTTPDELEGCVHCTAYHEIFDQPGGDYDYITGLVFIYTQTEHVCCEATEV